MFHAGHVAILKQAREYGDYLIAGVHSDEVVNDQRGLNMPIMNLNERVLSVLGCVYVNDVLIDAPLHITRYVDCEEPQISSRCFPPTFSFMGNQNRPIENDTIFTYLCRWCFILWAIEIEIRHERGKYRNSIFSQR